MINQFLLIPFYLISFLIGSKPPNLTFQYHEAKDSVVTIQLSFVGDIMCHTPQMEFAKIGKDSFDFKPVFREVKNYLINSDFTFGNLETVISGKNNKLSGYPLFNSPDELLDALHDSGFDLLFTSNNHCLDKGIRGIENTINSIRQKGMRNHGTFMSTSEKDSSVHIDVKGIRIGILSYTYGFNGNFLPKENNYMVSLIDTNQIKIDIEKQKLINPDFVLVYFHFGDEYSRKPSNFQKEIVEKTFYYGADIIIASHPHVIQPIEYVIKKNGKLKVGIVTYSIGNFISNQRWRYSDSGVILNIGISKMIHNDSTWISSVDFIPTWVFKGKTNNGNEFIILPSDTTLLKPTPEFLKKDDLLKLNQSNQDTKGILRSLNNLIN